MNRDAFVLTQYESLRVEIKETKSRIFYIAAIGLFVLPGGEYLAKAIGAPEIRLALPLLVVCVGFLYLAENHALMRCGRYIRLHVEPEVHDHLGWEAWLEGPDAADPRKVGRYMAYAFYLLLFVYYIVATAAAFRATRIVTHGGYVLPTMLLLAYVGLGVLFLGILFREIHPTTTTLFDTPAYRVPRPPAEGT
jgi:hypothetical protein